MKRIESSIDSGQELVVRDATMYYYAAWKGKPVSKERQTPVFSVIIHIYLKSIVAIIYIN